MTTLEPPALRSLATRWERGIDGAAGRDDAATFSGIVGNLAHRTTGGYHISREDQPSSNYSIARYAVDREGPSNLASAVDMTMRPAEMILVTRRLVKAWNAGDPRLAHVRAFNGTLDGKNALRWDRSTSAPYASTDDHLWHVHLEVHRKWANDQRTADDIASVVLGLDGGSDDVGTLDGKDPYEPGMPQAAELRNSYYALMAGYQDAKAGPSGVVARLARIEAAIAKVGSPSDAQIGVIADRVAAALVAHPGNSLGEKDAPVIVAAVKTALREGSA